MQLSNGRFLNVPQIHVNIFCFLLFIYNYCNTWFTIMYEFSYTLSYFSNMCRFFDTIVGFSTELCLPCIAMFPGATLAGLLLGVNLFK